MLNDSTKPETGPNKTGKISKSSFNFGNPLKVSAYALGIFIASQFIAVIILALYLAIVGGETRVNNFFESPSVLNQFVTILFTEATALLMLYLVLGKKIGNFKDLGLIAPKLKDLPVAGIGFIAFYVILFAVSLIIYNLMPSIDINQEQDLGFEELKNKISHEIRTHQYELNFNIDLNQLKGKFIDKTPGI